MSFAPGGDQLCVVNSAVVADDEELSALSAVVLDQTMQEAYEPESRLMLTQSLLPEGSLPDPLH